MCGIVFTGRIVCVFNQFHDKWTECDEKRLQIVLNALNEEKDA